MSYIGGPYPPGNTTKILGLGGSQSGKWDDIWYIENHTLIATEILHNIIWMHLSNVGKEIFWRHLSAPYVPYTVPEKSDFIAKIQRNTWFWVHSQSGNWDGGWQVEPSIASEVLLNLALVHMLEAKIFWRHLIVHNVLYWDHIKKEMPPKY